MDALSVRDLRKSYGGREALKGISFSVREGEVFGLIGPNGAGKTTTLRIVSTLLSVTSGEVEVCGVDLASDPDRVRGLISYLPEDAGAYKDMTGRRYLRFMAGFFADGEEAEAMAERGMEIAALGGRIDSKVDTYSKGMMRRLLIARAVMPNPRLAILDEATSGLDAVNAYEVRRLIRGLADRGVSVLISSHNMFEVELLCDRVAMIDGGAIVLEGTPAEIKGRYGAASLEEAFVKAVGA